MFLSFKANSTNLKLKMMVIDLPVLSHLRSVKGVKRAVGALLFDPSLVRSHVVPQSNSIDSNEIALLAR